MNQPLIQPASIWEYSSAIEAGEAWPSVYHSLMEVAIASGMAPQRLVVVWCLRQTLWGAVSTAGAGLLLLDHWLIGLAVMALAVWTATKHVAPLNVRLGYCAARDAAMATWGLRSGYLSLRPVPEERRVACETENRRRLEIAEFDLAGEPSVWKSVVNFASGIAVILAKAVVGCLLLLTAWREPTWLSVGIGGLIGVFFVIQSLLRLPRTLSVFGPR